MAFTVMSWNVKKFGSKKRGESSAQRRRRVKAHVARVAEHIKERNPDVFALFEIENADLEDLMDNHFPDYDFHLTDGPQTMEIMVAARRRAFRQAAFTTKRQFKEGTKLRPGAFLSVKHSARWYSLLFLHIDSGIEAGDFGNRFDAIDKIWKLKKALDRRAEDGGSRLIVAGDLNTMGMNYPGSRRSDERVSQTEEIEAVGKLAKKAGMELLEKNHNLTWHSSSRTWTSDLDHVIASDAVDIRGPVRVEGWVDATTATARKRWVRDYSDHASLMFNVQ